ncbi:MAG: 30S ribosomal protein S21 [Candidatus Sungbacteria bacterium]|uniref:Small ribosomal subunit protein bS21 n=1 Tax=Candidatus Sungiibacteriota bacterium TaxID=2750080 RepID=A0A9D6QU90_9BACT|nr:30S ribosomal protein S21 [Candidatus Sungbacteria bacterium]
MPLLRLKNKNQHTKNKILMVEVRRKEKETFGALLRRFTRRVQMSGVLKDARKTRFYAKPPTKIKKRDSALRRLQKRKERSKLEKLGKLKDEKKVGR